MGQFDEKLKKEVRQVLGDMTEETMMGKDLLSELDEVRIVLLAFFHVALHSFVRKMIWVTLV